MKIRREKLSYLAPRIELLAGSSRVVDSVKGFGLRCRPSPLEVHSETVSLGLL